MADTPRILLIAAILVFMLTTECHCVTDTGQPSSGGAWRMVFKAEAGTGQPVYDKWIRRGGHNEDIEDAYSLTDDVYEQYKCSLVDDWVTSGAKEAKLGIYNDVGEEQAAVYFDLTRGDGTDQYTWFSYKFYAASSWDDLDTVVPELFSIDGNGTDEHFVIRGRNSSVDVCDSVTWLLIDEPYGDHNCPWQELLGEYPYIIYANTPTGYSFNEGGAQYGHILAVFLDVQYIDGAWESWSPWSECAVTCGGVNTTQTRRRTCTNPENFNCGMPCFGVSMETRECGSYPCIGDWNVVFKVVAGVSDTITDVVANLATGTEVRHEGNGVAKAVTNELRDHYRSAVMNDWEIYNIEEVAVVVYISGEEILRILFNGSGSTNSDWFSKPRLLSHPWLDLDEETPPNFSIAGNSKSRTFQIALNGESCEENYVWFYVEDNYNDHTCSYQQSAPYPKLIYSSSSSMGNPHIEGETLDNGHVMAVMVDLKQVDGGWSDWSTWSECPVTCEGVDTTQSRNRTCNQPAPSTGGVDCDGDLVETRACGRYPCILHGNWSPWSSWAECPITCEAANTTVAYRFRNCSNPAPFNGGDDCPSHDPSNDTRICGQERCPTNVCFVFFNESAPDYALRNKLTPGFCDIANMTDDLTIKDVVQATSFNVGSQTPRAGDIYAVHLWLKMESESPFPADLLEVQDRLQDYFTICGNMLDNRFDNQWSVIEDYDVSAIRMMETCNQIGVTAGQANIGDMEFEHENIVVSFDFAVGDQFVGFDKDITGYGSVTIDTTVAADMNLLDDSIIGLVSIVYANSSLLFSNVPLEERIVVRENRSYVHRAKLENIDMEVGSHILSFAVLVDGLPYSVPVDFTLKEAIRDDTETFLEEPTCAYMNYESSVYDDAAWSYHQCWLVTTDVSSVSCHCNHTTVFAVIMDIVPQPLPSELVLRSVAFILCAVCVGAAGLTLIVYTCVRIKISDDLKFIHTNALCAIICITIPFMSGVDSWNSQTTCKVVAIFLRVSWTSLFLWIIMETRHFFLEMTPAKTTKEEKMINKKKKKPRSNAIGVMETNVGRTENGAGRVTGEEEDGDKKKLMKHYEDESEQCCTKPCWGKVIIGWGIPMVVVAVSAGLFPEMYGNNQNCWWYLAFQPFDYVQWVFLSPDVLFMTINAIMLIAVRIRLRKHANKYVSAGIRRCGGLFALFCAAYVIGLAAVNWPSHLTTQYVFSGIMATAGLFFFVFHFIINNEAPSVLEKKTRISEAELMDTLKIVLEKNREQQYKQHKRDGYRHTDISVIREEVDEEEVFERLPGLRRLRELEMAEMEPVEKFDDNEIIVFDEMHERKSLSGDNSEVDEAESIDNDDDNEDDDTVLPELAVLADGNDDGDNDADIPDATEDYYGNDSLEQIHKPTPIDLQEDDCSMADGETQASQRVDMSALVNGEPDQIEKVKSLFSLPDEVPNKRGTAPELIQSMQDIEDEDYLI
ncbi:adhesion G protein-coupled receptor B1-like [Saccoglossus kowalevskii]